MKRINNAEDKICIKLTTDGTGKCSMAILFASSSVDEHNEYPRIAKPTYKFQAEKLEIRDRKQNNLVIHTN